MQSVVVRVLAGRYHSRYALQVGRDLHLCPAGQKRSDLFFHRETNLHYQPAAGMQGLVGLRNKLFINVYAFLSGEDGHLGLKLAYLPLHFVSFALTDIRRVRDHKVELRSRIDRKQVRTAELDPIAQAPVIQKKTGCVDAGDFQGFFRDIARVNLRQRQLGGQGQSDASRACAHINQREPFMWIALLRQFEHGLNYVLRLRTRNENRRRDDQVQPPEFLMACDVLRRTTTRPLLSHRIILGLLFRRERALRMGVEVSAVAIQGKHEEQLGIEPGRRDIFLQEKLVSGINSLLEMHKSRWQVFCSLPRTLSLRSGGDPTADDSMKVLSMKANGICPPITRPPDHARSPNA